MKERREEMENRIGSGPQQTIRGTAASIERDREKLWLMSAVALRLSVEAECLGISPECNGNGGTTWHNQVHM